MAVGSNRVVPAAAVREHEKRKRELRTEDRTNVIAITKVEQRNVVNVQCSIRLGFKKMTKLQTVHTTANSSVRGKGTDDGGSLWRRYPRKSRMGTVQCGS